MTSWPHHFCQPAIKNDSSAILSDGKRFVVRADEKLTAFVELERAIRGSQNSGIRSQNPQVKAAIDAAVNHLKAERLGKALLVATGAAGAACGGFGFALNTAAPATFDICYWL